MLSERASFNPFGNGTVASRWRAEPKFRGTWGILSSCLITMILCIWTAVHLNMPGKKSIARQFLRKTNWLIIGLFAPEMVAWTAFQQYKTARILTREMRDVLGCPSQPSSWRRLLGRDKPSSSSSEEPLVNKDYGSLSRWHRQPWTIVHSFYAIMGGFAIDATLLPNALRPAKGDPYLVLTVDGLRFMIEKDPLVVRDLMPHISREHIEDKSNASSLAKSIVCMQALWFCFQCIIRFTTPNLSVSLLELNTFAHALCAILIYFLWWNKPLDVEEPILIDGQQHKSILTAMVSLDLVETRMANFWFHDEERTRLRKPVGKTHQVFVGLKLENDIYHGYEMDHTTRSISAYTDYNFCRVLSLGHLSPYKTPEKKIPISEGNMRDGYSSEESSIYMLLYQPFNGFRLRVAYNDSTLSTKDKFPRISMNFTAEEAQFLESAKEGMERLGIQQSSLQDATTFKSLLKMKTYRFAPRAGEWPKLGSWNSTGIHLNGQSLLAGFTLAGLVYGLLHLIAWNAPFPSTAEKILWRASGLTLCISGLILIFAAIVPYEDGPIMSFLSSLSFALMFYMCVCYLGARVYLVVECFLELPRLPDSAFELPVWSQYFPHIS